MNDFHRVSRLAADLLHVSESGDGAFALDLPPGKPPRFAACILQSIQALYAVEDLRG